MEKTIFEKIIDRESPAEIVYENEYVLAFLDVFPVKEGHTLVVPKKHAENMLGSTEEDMAHVMAAVRKLVPVVMEITKASGCNVISNIGPSAGQSVLHTHVHIIPRLDDDGLQMWPQRAARPEELGVTGEKIRKAL